MTDDDRPTVCVVAPEPMLTIEIETDRRGDQPEIHLHPGGQGLWVANLANALGARVVVCGPFGGETGDVTAHLARSGGLELRATTEGGGGTLLRDRRAGGGTDALLMPPTPLDRHALDDFYGAALVAGLEADVCVLTGFQQDLGVPVEHLARLAKDVAASGTPVVADLGGEQAAAVAAEGVAVLKMSHEQMVEAGAAQDDSVDALRRAAEEQVAAGCGAVVVSRADEATLLVTGDGAWAVTTPSVSTVDPRGAGDSMTAGIAVGLARGLDVVEAVRLAAAAGALNATRHGLGSGRRVDIEDFARQVTVETLEVS